MRIPYEELLIGTGTVLRTQMHNTPPGRLDFDNGVPVFVRESEEKVENRKKIVLHDEFFNEVFTSDNFDIKHIEQCLDNLFSAGFEIYIIANGKAVQLIQDDLVELSELMKFVEQGLTDEQLYNFMAQEGIPADAVYKLDIPKLMQIILETDEPCIDSNCYNAIAKDWIFLNEAFNCKHIANRVAPGFITIESQFKPDPEANYESEALISSNDDLLKLTTADNWNNIPLPSLTNIQLSSSSGENLDGLILANIPWQNFAEAKKIAIYNTSNLDINIVLDIVKHLPKLEVLFLSHCGLICSPNKEQPIKNEHLKSFFIHHSNAGSRPPHDLNATRFLEEGLLACSPRLVSYNTNNAFACWHRALGKLPCKYSNSIHRTYLSIPNKVRVDSEPLDKNDVDDAIKGLSSCTETISCYLKCKHLIQIAQEMPAIMRNNIKSLLVKDLSDIDQYSLPALLELFPNLQILEINDQFLSSLGQEKESEILFAIKKRRIRLLVAVSNDSSNQVSDSHAAGNASAPTLGLNDPHSQRTYNEQKVFYAPEARHDPDTSLYRIKACSADLQTDNLVTSLDKAFTLTPLIGVIEQLSPPKACELSFDADFRQNIPAGQLFATTYLKLTSQWLQLPSVVAEEQISALSVFNGDGKALEYELGYCAASGMHFIRAKDIVNDTVCLKMLIAPGIAKRPKISNELQQLISYCESFSLQNLEQISTTDLVNQPLEILLQELYAHQAEMRDRVIAALQLGLETTAPADEYKHKFWVLARRVLARDKQAGWDLIDNPMRLKIQTIDALCSSITTQQPILAQFGAQPQIEPKADVLYQQAVERLLQESAQSALWQTELNILLSHLDNDRVKVSKLLVSMLGVRDQWLPVVVKNLSQADIRHTLEAALALTVEDALTTLNAAVPAVLDFAVLSKSAPLSVDDWLPIINILLTKDLTWRRTVTEKQGFPAPSKSKNKQEQAQLKANKDAMLLMLERLTAHEVFRQHLIALTKLPPICYSESQWSILSALSVVLRVLVAQLTLVFKDTGTVDFSAVSLAALHALGDQDPPTDLALALDCKIAHILVDEFQDTSILQFELLEKLVANWEPYAGKTLFLVGDPMQSIYRFRKAEVGLFLKAKQQGIQQIELDFVRLTVNFRSGSQIVSWINNVFAQSFPDQDDLTYGAISYMPAVASRDELDSNQAIECYAVNLQDEANKIVEIIKNVGAGLCAGPDPIAVRQNKSIAILVRAKSHLAEILPALRAANIAYQGIEIESLSKSSLVQDLLALTKALLHLDDRIAWLAILRAPWCGLCLADLLLLGQPEHTIWQALQDADIIASLSGDGQLRASRFISVIAAVLSQRGRQTIDVQVQTAWENLGGPQYTVELAAVEAYFTLLADLASKREIFNPDFLDQQVSDLFIQPQAIADNAVQIMTMHKAKGLEFDIVILPSLAKRTKGDAQKLFLLENRSNPHEHLLMAPIKGASEQEDLIYKYLAWSESKRQEFEDLRLLYVATTRAREKIYCLGEVGANGPQANTMLGKIWDCVAHEFINIDSQESAVATLKRATINRLPSDWYENNIYTAQIIETTEQQLEPWQPDWLRLVGLVVHRIFYTIATVGIENLELTQIMAQKPVWQQHLRQLGMPSTYNAQAIQLIEQAVQNILADPMGVNILSAQHAETYAEWPLTARYGDDFKQYILDRAFLDQAGQFWIVDYKVVHAEEELPQAIERYTAQLLNYAGIVRRMRPGLKIKTGLYFPLQKQWCEL